MEEFYALQEMSQILTAKDISWLSVAYDALALLPLSQVKESESMFFQRSGKTLSLLTTNNYQDLYHKLLDQRTAKWFTITSFFTDASGFAEALKRYDQREIERQKAFQENQYRHHAAGKEAIELLQQTFINKETYTEGDFIAEVLRLSYQAGASDLHFQTEDKGVVARLRKDGILQTLFTFTHEEFQKYVMKFKYMAGVKMNVITHSQDGRFSIHIKKDEEQLKIDIRASFIPALRGESIVLRFLDATKGILPLPALGFQTRHQEVIEQQLTKHHGLILVAWPTGSGKTTTVYSLLNLLNSAEKKIITLEDPVEYEMPGITQSQINESTGYTFEEGLKGVLRHDPDIIMVGEIRSLQSAELAVNAAITGHLVISTVHTNSAVEAVTRLLNMGVKPFMLTASLNCIIAQRLVRKAVRPLAVDAPGDIDAQLIELLRRLHMLVPDAVVPYEHLIYQQNTEDILQSYEGRTGVFECLPLSKAIKQAILDNQTTIQLQKIVDEEGFLSMQDDALIKMLQQITCIEEVMRVM